MDDLTPIFGPLGAWPVLFILIVLVWSVIWKGLGLWRTAKTDRKYWFIAILLFNTVGILPILYLAFFQKKKK